MSIGLAIFTLFHTALSLVGIFAGFVVLYGLLTARRLDKWAAIFLATTVATSVTGFLFPVDHFMPSHGVGIVSLLVLPFAIFALYKRHLAGSWRWIYVVASVIALYLNFFVLIVMAFRRVPALKTLAPTQSEPPFALTQLVVLLIFMVLGVLAVMKFRTAQVPSSLIAPAQLTTG